MSKDSNKLVKIEYCDTKPCTLLDGSRRRLYHGSILEVTAEQAVKMCRNPIWRLHVEKKATKGKKQSQSRGVTAKKSECINDKCILSNKENWPCQWSIPDEGCPKDCTKYTDVIEDTNTNKTEGDE